MATPNPKISEMINNIPGQTEAAESQESQLDEQITELTEERDAIQDDVCGATADDLKTYLEGDKLAEIQALWPPNPDVPPNVPPFLGDVYISYDTSPDPTLGPYGSISYETGNVKNWQYLQDDLTNVTTIVRYSWAPEVGWDNDPTIIGFSDDFDFGNDYITRPLDSGASYGLNDKISAYNSAKGIVTNNKDKIVASDEVLRRHL